MLGDIFKAVWIGVVAGTVGIFVALVSIFAIFFFAILGALVGAITGWIVSLTPVLGGLVSEGFLVLGLKNPNLVAIGAMLGFVAGFFKSSCDSKCKHEN